MLDEGYELTSRGGRLRPRPKAWCVKQEARRTRQRSRRYIVANQFHSLFSLLCLFDDNVCKCMCVIAICSVRDLEFFDPTHCLTIILLFYPLPNKDMWRALFGLLCCYNEKNIHGEEIYLVSFAYPKEAPMSLQFIFLM